jgi:ankyrin repeat protein
LVHDACVRGNLPLLEALDQNRFGMNSTNKKGETPLHRAASSWSESTKCTEFLLERFLGKLYTPLDEEIVARTPDEQRYVEDTLSQRDANGRTPLLVAAFGNFANNAMLLIHNLLGPLMIPWWNEELVTRTELEQQQVERILSVRDSTGFSALHGALGIRLKYKSLMMLLLKNLLGKYFIDDINWPMQRTLEKQKQIALLLQPKNQRGVTPLLYSVIICHCYEEQRLLLMNLLGDYFVEEDGTTERPVDSRTDEENEFVRSVCSVKMTC